MYKKKLILILFGLYTNNELRASNDSTFYKDGYIIHYIEKNKLSNCYNYFFIDNENHYEENKVVKTLKWEDVLINKEKYLNKYVHLLVVSSKIENWSRMTLIKKFKNANKYHYKKGNFLFYKKNMTVEEYTGTRISTSQDYLCLPIISQYLFVNVLYLLD